MTLQQSGAILRQHYNKESQGWLDVQSFVTFYLNVQPKNTLAFSPYPNKETKAFNLSVCYTLRQKQLDVRTFCFFHLKRPTEENVITAFFFFVFFLACLESLL